MIGGGVVGSAGDEREDGATSEEKTVRELEGGAAPSLSVFAGVLPRGSDVKTAARVPARRFLGARRTRSARVGGGLAPL